MAVMVVMAAVAATIKLLGSLYLDAKKEAFRIRGTPFFCLRLAIYLRLW